MNATLMGTGIGAVAALALTLVTKAVVPSPPFITVHEISYSGGEVKVDLTVHTESGDVEFADWHVWIVPEDRAVLSPDRRPVCSTQHGPNIHEGWSDYYPGPLFDVMPLDTWVGDKGCFERLPEGESVMHVVWSPRDGTDPVSWRGSIIIEDRSAQ